MHLPAIGFEEGRQIQGHLPRLSRTRQNQSQLPPTRWGHDRVNCFRFENRSGVFKGAMARGHMFGAPIPRFFLPQAFPQVCHCLEKPLHRPPSFDRSFRKTGNVQAQVVELRQGVGRLQASQPFGGRIGEAVVESFHRYHQ